MPNHVRNNGHVPPGNYYYKLIFENGVENKWFGPCGTNGNCRRFGPSPTIDEPARGLGAFRRANHLPRSSQVEAEEDISLYTCERIGNNSQWCFDSEKPFGQLNPQSIPAPCATCGHSLA